MLHNNNTRCKECTRYEGEEDQEEGGGAGEEATGLAGLLGHNEMYGAATAAQVESLRKHQ